MERGRNDNEGWKYAGHKLVVNYCAVAAVKVAYNYASVSREDFNAFLFATVVDCVLVANV